jgi:8-oxo-dGTP pyrophosphatase MutT (NUDIX family)
MRYTAVLAFKHNDGLVALAKKNSKRLPHLLDKWNGIGGKAELWESPVGAAMREFREETGIAVAKDDMVLVEHQRFDILLPSFHEIYWYATRLPDGTDLPIYNDAHEVLMWCHVEHIVQGNAVRLCPNVDYLVPKAVVFLRTPYLDRPV